MKYIISGFSIALLVKESQAGGIGTLKYDVGNLSGGDGFQFDGVDSGDLLDGDYTGKAVAYGDFNGDGLSDIIATAPVGGYNAGYAYVLFGTNGSLSSPLDNNDLDGSTGFIIYGETTYDYLGGIVGSVSSADVNGDDYDDIIIGAYGAGIGGETYIIFGSGTIGSSGLINVDELSSSTGVVLSGSNSGDDFGSSVCRAGDVNGDGYEDIIVGAKQADVYGSSTTSSAGKAYVLFGSASLSGTYSSSDLTGSVGFTINGDKTDDTCGTGVAGVGDLNNDGYDDVLVNCQGGYYYMVVFGSAVIGSSGSLDVDDLTGSDGCIWNADSDDFIAGINIDGGFDFNGDGYDDFIVGAPYNGDGNYYYGAAFVVFGGSSVCNSASNNLADDLDGSNGFKVIGQAKYDYLGSSVSGAGDLNGDGYDDIIIGAPRADIKSNTQSGAVYVIYGQASSLFLIKVKNIDSSTGRILYGGSYTYIGSSVSSAGDFNNDGALDIIIGSYLISEFYVIFYNSTDNSIDDDNDDGGSGGGVFYGVTQAMINLFVTLGLFLGFAILFGSCLFILIRCHQRYQRGQQLQYQTSELVHTPMAHYPMMVHNPPIAEVEMMAQAVTGTQVVGPKKV